MEGGAGEQGKRSGARDCLGGGGGCLLTGVGEGVVDSLLVLFYKERLVSSLPENHCGEHSAAPWLQYARGAC